MPSTAPASKKDADAREAEVTVNVGKGTHIAPSKTPTVREAGKLWLDACADLERASVEAYRQHVHLHIEPYLGHYRLAHLTPQVIRQFEDDLRAGKTAPIPTDKKPGERFKSKRSPAMVRKVITTLGTMLADMQERGLVAINAVHGASVRPLATYVADGDLYRTARQRTARPPVEKCRSEGR